MGSAMLYGCLILIAEDEPIIAIDLNETFESAGARGVIATTMADALLIAEDTALAAAVVNYRLADGDSTGLCSCLRHRKIPFMMYSGYPASGASSGGLILSKPATPGDLLSAMGKLLNLVGGRPPVTQMGDRPTALERAFELAGSGVCASVDEIRARLKSEGFQGAQITGRTLTNQLSEQIKQVEKSGAP